MPPEVLLGLVVQIPLVAVVAWVFTTGRVHSDAELKRRERDHAAELLRERTGLQRQNDDWRALYNQERADRVKADERLTIATSELKEVTSRVEELTKEVIRNARP